jgi:hypothetical protein
LSQYLGSKLVDPQEQVLFQDKLAVSDILAATLEDEFQQAPGGEA